jgi:hypothetical protein
MDVRKALVAVGLALLVGCSVGEYGESTEMGGGVDAGNTGADNDETSFTIMVKPTAVEALCTGCHGAQPPTLTGFDKMQAQYKTKAGAMILKTKGAHQGNPYFNATQQAAINAWVDGLSK